MACSDYDAFAAAWARIKDTFNVREGHGRLKNNLFDPSRPPDLLVNVIVEPPGYFSVVGEVQASGGAIQSQLCLTSRHFLQIHMQEILLLKEVCSPPRPSHRLNDSATFFHRNPRTSITRLGVLRLRGRL